MGELRFRINFITFGIQIFILIKLQKRKVIIVGTAHPFRGGLAAYNERLANEFQNEGDDITIETFKLQYPNFLFPGKTQYATWEAPENLNINISVNSINPFNWIKVGRKIKAQKPDLVIFKYWLPFLAPCFGTIAKTIKKNKHTKVICILDNIIPHEKRPGDNMLTKYFVKHIDAFVAMSKSVLNDLSIFDTNKPRKYNPHPLFDNFGAQLSKQEALDNLNLDKSFNYLLFFGIIRDYKGLDLLLKAFADKRLREYPVKLIVAGEFYTDQEKYLQLIKENNLEEHVILHAKFIPDGDVTNYFSAADMIVQPYKAATQSGVTQIGYHFNKPMLVTNVGGLGEIIPDGKAGYVVEPDVNEISNALVDFYQHNKEEFFIENVKKEKERFSWKKMIETVNELYSEIK